MSEALKELLAKVEAAFVAGVRAGWQASGEGWSAEYPADVSYEEDVVVAECVAARKTLLARAALNQTGLPPAPAPLVKAPVDDARMEAAALAIFAADQAPIKSCWCMGAAEGEPACRCKMERYRSMARAAIKAMEGG